MGGVSPALRGRALELVRQLIRPVDRCRRRCADSERRTILTEREQCRKDTSSIATPDPTGKHSAGRS